MLDNGRRVVLDLPFEAALGETSCAIRSEGMAVIARIEVRDHFRTAVRRECRRYELLDAWAPDEAFDELNADPDRGATLPIRFAVYELADGETAVIVDDRGRRAARVMGRLRRLPRSVEATPAA